MAASKEELERELNELAQSVRSATEQMNSSNKFGKIAADKLTTSFRDLTRVTKTTVGAINNANGEFSAFNGAVQSTSNMLQRMAGQNTKLGAAFSFSVAGLQKIIQSVFGYQDSVIKMYDGFGELGITADRTTKDISKLTQGASYWIGRHEKFAKNLTEAGTTLTALGETTSKGAGRLATIYNNVDYVNVQEDFLRIGIGPEELNKMQNNYLKMGATYGMKLDASDAHVRERTLQYAVSVNKISALTGERRDQVEEEFAVGQRDVKFNMKKRQLERSGNTAALKAFEEAAAMTGTLGKGIQAGLQDFIASGTATTEEGRALMIKTGGQVQAWIKAVEEGRMTSLELTKRIAKAEKSFVGQNEEALRYSDSFAAQMQTSGKSIANMDKLINASEADFKKQMSTQGKTPDSVKNLQSAEINAQREQGRALNSVSGAVSEQATKALLALINTVRSIGVGALKLGIMLTPAGEAKENMEEFLRILGTDTDTKNSLAKMDEEVRKATENVEISNGLQDKTNELQKNKSDLEKEQQELLAKKQRGEQVDERRLAENRAKILADSQKLKELEKERQEKLKGKSREQLLEEQRALIRKRSQAARNQFYKSGESGETVVEGTEGATNAYEGLNIKSQETVAGGPVDPKLLELAKNIQSKFPGVKFTALNDAYHQKNRPTSKHTKGRAMDFTTNPGPKDAKEAAAIKKQLYDMGFAYVADEYFADRGTYTTAGHFHAHIGYADGGIASGPKSGYKATLHGTEAIIPMLDGKTVSIELKQANETNDFSNITNQIKAKSMMMSSTTSSNRGTDSKNAAYTLLGKIETMITSIEQSNSTQEKLKMYLRN